MLEGLVSCTLILHFRDTVNIVGVRGRRLGLTIGRRFGRRGRLVQLPAQVVEQRLGRHARLGGDLLLIQRHLHVGDLLAQGIILRRGSGRLRLTGQWGRRRSRGC